MDVLRRYDDFDEVRRQEKYRETLGPDAEPSACTAFVPYVPANDPSRHHEFPSLDADDAVSRLLSNPRTRIATVSSGYRKANFFVREDLDTRIYFHQLEDAVGYMARRGYSRMSGEEEREWRELLRRAHGVVKRGPKKEKQRYRKGKLVLILKKTVQENADKPRSSRKKSSSASNGSTASSDYTSSMNSLSHAGTERTSLGRSIRGPDKSYSEKFLAEQEEERKQVLLAITEGRPVPDAYANARGQLLLTAGPAAGPVDPSARSESGYDESTRASSGGNGTAAGSRGGGARSTASDLRKSHRTLSSNRKGVYGGGVRYFTPDSARDDDSEEETTEDESFADESEEEGETYEEEEETYTEDSYDDDGSGRYDSVAEAGGDMGSMIDGDDGSYSH